MGDGARRGAGFERDGSTLRFGQAGSRTAVSICSPRIIRVDLEVEGQAAGPSHLEPRAWADTRFEALDGEPLRLSTADLTIEVATDPVRLAFLDSAGARLMWRITQAQPHWRSASSIQSYGARTSRCAWS